MGRIREFEEEFARKSAEMPRFEGYQLVGFDVDGKLVVGYIKDGDKRILGNLQMMKGDHEESRSNL